MADLTFEEVFKAYEAADISFRVTFYATPSAAPISVEIWGYSKYSRSRFASSGTFSDLKEALAWLQIPLPKEKP